MGTKRLISVILVCCLLLCMLEHTIFAAQVEPIAPMDSEYIATCSASLSRGSGRTVDVSFLITAPSTMDTLGVRNIQIYKSSDGSSWEWVQEYSYNDYPSFLKDNAGTHSGEISFTGTYGYYYKALVNFWATLDGAVDHYYYYTGSVKVSLL